MGERTYADGGSATTQASENTAAWRPRPIVAFAIRSLTVLGPIVASFAMTRVYGLILTPDSLGAPAYWAGLLLVAVVTAVAVEREAQHVLPLAALFRMSLVFPDAAPNRFGVALRDGTARKLTAQAEATGDAEAAADLLVLVRELSRHDPLTRGHSERVRAYADLIAIEMGLSEHDRHRLAWGALAHDVGKIEVRSSTLNKPGRPNDEEWAEIRNHPAAAVDRMAGLEPWLGEWALAASQHHERWDGNGYPNGLRAEEISLAGRIVAVADAYDVMTATRSYKKPLTPEIAREELINNAESQFDPEVVRAFLHVGVRRLHLAGLLAWVNEIAWFLRAPQAVSAVGSTAVSTTATAVIAIGTAVTTAPLEEAPIVVDEISAERSVDLETTDPSRDASFVVDGVAVTVLPDPGNPGSTPAPAPDSRADEEPGPTAPTADSADPDAPTVAPPSDSEPSSTTSSPPPASTVETVETTPAATDPNAELRELGSPVLLGAAGDAGHHRIAMDAALQVGGDEFEPTLVLERSTSIDDARRHDHAHLHFQLPAADGLRLAGRPGLTIWLAAADFAPAATAGIHVELLDCGASGSSCVRLADTTQRFAQAEFGDRFGRVELDFGTLDHSLAAGRTLVLDVYVDPTSDTDLWLGFGTTIHPASFHVS